MTSCIKPLSEIAEVIMGQSPPGETYNENDQGLPFFQGKADFGHLYPVVRKWCSCPVKVADVDDILISVRAPVGPTNLADQQCCIGRGLAAIRANRQVVMPKYLLYHLRNIESVLATKGQGSTFSAINKTDLNSIAVPVPPLAEQRRIVGLLDRADELRRKREQANKRMQDLISSLLIYMFGDPVTNSRGWDTCPLETVSDVQGGLQLSSKRNNLPLSMPYLRVANVYRDKLDLGEIKYMSLSESEFNRVQLKPGDVLVVEGHGNPNEIGRSAVWDGSIDPCIHQNHLIRVRPNIEVLLPEYLSVFINSPGGKRYFFSEGSTTSGLNTISVSKVKRCVIPLPPIDLQQEFVKRLRNFESIIANQEQSTHNTGKLLNSLMNKILQ